LLAPASWTASAIAAPPSSAIAIAVALLHTAIAIAIAVSIVAVVPTLATTARVLMPSTPAALRPPATTTSALGVSIARLLNSWWLLLTRVRRLTATVVALSTRAAAFAAIDAFGTLRPLGRGIVVAGIHLGARGSRRATVAAGVSAVGIAVGVRLRDVAANVRVGSARATAAA
jgi:hypothetical protein